MLDSAAKSQSGKTNRVADAVATECSDEATKDEMLEAVAQKESS